MLVNSQHNMACTAVVITVSDSAAKGSREDLGGPLAAAMLIDAGFEVVERIVVPDEEALISALLQDRADKSTSHLIVTTGGTGLGPRDVTPQATLAVCDYQVPGLAEAMRSEGRAFTPFAMLSRQVVAVRKQTLILNLPGSPKGVKQGLDTVLPVLFHAIQLLTGDTVHPAAQS